MTNKASSFPAAPAIGPLHRYGGRLVASGELAIHASGDSYTLEGSGTVSELPTLQAGALVWLLTEGTPTFKNSRTLSCPNGVDYAAAANELLIARSKADGVWQLYPVGPTLGTNNVPAAGFVNKLRNSSLTSWFHGSSALTITTAGAWGAEGVYIVPTGASVTAAQIANGLSSPLTFWAQKITGNTSVTDVTVRFVIESYDAAPLAGQQVTFQVPVLNSTGGTITPTITVKSPSAQDSWGSPANQVTAVALQSIANGATGVLAYSWTAANSSNLGLSIDIDFGNNFSTTGKSVQIGGGFDCRVTPGAATGLVANPPSPEIRTATDDIAWNQRFYETTYDNGIKPGTATHTGMATAGVTGDGTNDWGGIIPFKVLKRADATVSYWDGNGNANRASYYENGSWVDNSYSASSVAAQGQASFLWYGNASSAIYANAIHFVADATLTGA